MAEYIERTAVEEMLENAQIISNGEYCGYCTEDVNLNSIPAADVVPVVHGKWVKAHWKNSVSCANCSICGFEAYHYDFQGVQKTYNYCPNCGAKMDGEEQDDELIL